MTVHGSLESGHDPENRSRAAPLTVFTAWCRRTYSRARAGNGPFDVWGTAKSDILLAWPRPTNA